MSPQTLFRHPVGRFPLAARWYLALSAMLALLLVAAHFANQIRAQEQARAAVAGWAARAGAEVGGVRYRLLRNALELRDVRWRHGGAELFASRLLVRLDPASFTRARPVVRRMRIEHAVALLPADMEALADMRRVFGGAELADVRRIELADVRLRWRGDGADWLRLEAGDAFWRSVGGWRGHGRGQLAGGAFEAVWRVGVVRWRFRAARAARLFRTAIAGQVDGHGRWPVAGGGCAGAKEGREAWQAALDWRAGAPLEAQAGSLRMACAAAGTLRWRAEGWPLASLRGLMPAAWPASGWLEAAGVLHPASGAHGWRLRAPSGALREAAWPDGRRVLRLDWQALTLDARGWRAAKVEMADGVWAWSPAGWAGDGAMPRVDRLTFRNMTWLLPLLHARAPGVSGALVRQGRGWRLHARSPADAEAAEDGVISGVRLEATAGDAADAAIGLRAEAVNLAFGDHRLRLRDASLTGALSPRGLHVRRLHAGHWRWLAPLTPFTGQPGEGADGEGVDRDGPARSGWPAGLRVDEAVFEDGRLAVGREDAVWGEGMSLTLRGIAPGALAVWRLRGRLAEGALAGEGRWRPGVGMGGDGMAGRLTLEDALPFAFNDWLRASRMPRLLRGRLHASLDWRDGHWRFAARLARPLPEEGAFPDDPMLRWVGRSLRDVLARWPARRGVLRWQAEGDWQGRPLLAAWRAGLRDAIRKRLARADAEGGPRKQVSGWQPRMETAVRLHARSGLSHNERARLRRLWRGLRAHRDWIAELAPRWNGALTPSLVARIRRTQRLAERFFTERGIAPARIFPVWPAAMHRGGELGAVKVGIGLLR